MGKFCNICYSQKYYAIEEITRIAKENHVEKIIVGKPINMDNTIGFQAQNCIDFAQKISGFDIIGAVQ